MGGKNGANTCGQHPWDSSWARLPLLLQPSPSVPAPQLCSVNAARLVFKLPSHDPSSCGGAHAAAGTSRCGSGSGSQQGCVACGQGVSARMFLGQTVQSVERACSVTAAFAVTDIHGTPWAMAVSRGLALEPHRRLVRPLGSLAPGPSGAQDQ